MRTVFVLYCVICLIYVVVLSVRCFVVNFVDFYLLLVYFCSWYFFYFFFFFQAEDGIRDWSVTGVQTCALPILTWPALANYRVWSTSSTSPYYRLWLDDAKPPVKKT